MTLRRWARLNPLRVGGSGLSLEAALLAKLVIVALLVKRYDLLPERGVAFFAVLERGASGFDGFSWPRLAFYAGAAAVLFNLAPRTGSLLAGASVLAALLWNAGSFAHSRLFAACLLLLVAVAPATSATRFFRWQLVLLYGGAALNKGLDPDWWNGRFIDLYSASKPHLSFYPDLVAFAGLWPARLLSWSSMALEGAAAVAFARGRWAPVGIFCGLVLHTGIMAWLGFDFEAFVYTVLAAYAVAVDWPRRIEIWPPDGRAGARTALLLARIEWSDIWQVRERPDARGDRQDRAGRVRLAAHYADRVERRSGAAAWWYLVRHHPTLLVVGLALLAAPPPDTTLGWMRVGVLVSLLLVACMPAVWRRD